MHMWSVSEVDLEHYSTENAHFDRPTVVSVLRTESDRVPQVLISQASTDLRRTRSESQLIASTLDSISVCSSTSGGVEDEIVSVYTLSSLGSEPTNEPMLPPIDDLIETNGTITPSVLTPRAKDDTLTPGMTMAMVEQEVQSVASSLPTQREGLMAESISSFASSLSLRTEDDVDDEGGSLARNRPASTRKQRLHVALQASKRKVLDLMQKRRPVTPSSADNVEMGADAGDLDGAVEFDRENVLWGQSLHYDLDGTSSASPSKTSCRYLNITVHAKELPSTPTGPSSVEASPSSARAASVPDPEPPKPILLGYTSLYIPQILDDCQLTLSNCHREVYPLKPPTGVQSINESMSTEFSRHAGHDPRLCYGDVTLGFRFFPGGLPHGAGGVGIEESDEEVRPEETPEALKLRTAPTNAVPGVQHDWKPWSSKSSAMCAMCRGKIWLKSASRCQRCLVICHHKCVERAASGIACVPHTISQGDAEFTELDMDSSEQRAECQTSIIPATPQTTQPAVARNEDVELTSRRARLKNKMTEKFSSWRKGKTTSKLDLDFSGNRESCISESSAGTALDAEELQSPMASIQDCLGDVLPTLEGSPFIRSLYYEPGNAYNEQTISNAKVLGREIFAGLKGEERKAKINEQIDRIQLAIRETKDGRTAAIKDGSESKPSAAFEGLDERLQALAVLMLHYCSALQRAVLKFREIFVNPQSSIPKQLWRSLHVFSGESATNGHRESVVEFEPSIHHPDHEADVGMTDAEEKLNQAFILLAEEPDPRLES
ncbi:unnamed protein product [Heligmosomoides polygyrus]|uniref:Phorbol-ester/DAG-type domain-containing protein n=1 Tax=Heligmosomoides polygyrus TaxID=6339 RepID=A0A3P8CXL2_HELPZ|nr:unnamed protein product [Heligmosomoides polygyrus]